MRNAVGKNQHIFLIGGTSDIGLAMVEKLLERGEATVTLAARRSSSRLDDAIARVERAGGKDVKVLDFDATDFGSHPELVERAFERGDVDTAIVAFGTLGDQDRLWREHGLAVESAQTNYTAAVSVGVLLGQRLARQGHGNLVALSSVAGMRVRESNFVYGASKAGLDGFYTQLGEKLRRSGVHVLVVRPGQVRTHMTEGMDRAPLTVDPERVAADAVDALDKGKSTIFVHPLFKLVTFVFGLIPQPIFRKLPF